MGDLSIFDPISRLHLGKADSALFIGHAMTMPGYRNRACAACCVVHRGNGGTFTHVYLVPVDAGYRGEVFLAKVMEGDRVADAVGWSGRNLALLADSGARHAA